MKPIRSAAMATAIAFAALAAVAPASAAVVTFETATFGAGFTGPVTEGAFMYYNAGNALYVNEGNPGQDMEGTIADGGGVLGVAQTSFAAFTFAGLDYSAYSQTNTGTQTLTVSGYFEHALVAVDTFDLANSSAYSPLTNWTHFNASNLAGVDIDNLLITLNAGGDPGAQFAQAVDNVTLGDARGGSVPEPASWALMLIGFGGLGATLRARRRALAAA